MYRDYPLPEHWPVEIQGTTDRMTAIVSVLTYDGFVLGADGRGRDEKLEMVKNNFQKIFPAIGTPFGYAVYGNVGIGNEGTKDIIVDTRQELDHSFSALGGGEFADVVEYCEAVAKPVNAAILWAKEKGGLLRYPGDVEPNQPGLCIFRVWVFGYFNGSPCEVSIRFFHRDQKLCDPSIFQQQLRFGTPPKILGSGLVAQRLYQSNDTEFERFRKPFQSKGAGLSIPEAVQLIQSYIAACDSDEGRKLDPRFCEGIGGDVHIASITSTGFQWIEGFEYPKAIPLPLSPPSTSN